VMPEKLSVRDSTCAIWHGSCPSSWRGPQEVRRACWLMLRRKTMTSLVPESWQQTLGHLRANIHGTIDRWWRRHTPDGGSGQGEARYRDDTFWAPSLSFRGTPGVNVGETDDALIVTTNVPELKRDDYTVEIMGERLVVRGEEKQPTAQVGC